MGISNSTHLRQYFDAELQLLKDQLLQMGSLVASSVHRSISALTERNADLAHQVFRDEARVDAAEIQIDDLATRLIATQQPVARDMRLIVTAIKVNTELERMGDLAASIAERSLSLLHLDTLPGEVKDLIRQLSALVEDMVLKVLDAFVKADPEAARDIIKSDDAVDEIRSRIGDALVRHMKADSGCIECDIDLMINARSLERIADHATNIAEEIVFLVNGEDIRHRYGRAYTEGSATTHATESQNA